MLYSFIILFGVLSPHLGQGKRINVALGKPVFADSSHPGYEEKYGVDGDKDINSFYDSKKNGWFVVDLQGEYNVQFVLLYLYSGGEFIVGLTNTFEKDYDPPQRGKYSVCSQKPAEKLDSGRILNIKCNQGSSKARYVIIQKKDQNELLSFKELEVYAEDGDVSDIYMGCYEKRKDNYPHKRSVSEVEECLSACRNDGFWFSIIKNGSNCSCTKDLGPNLVASNKCSMMCSGDKYPCGGLHSYSAYQAKVMKKARPKHLGCFKDAKERDLPYNKNFDQLTIELCLETCLQEDYTYAAVQYGTNCFCGYSYGRHGPGDRCDMPCSGNKTQTCGGAYRNNVYEACYTYEGLVDTCSTDLHHCSDGKTPSSAGKCLSCEAGWKGPACKLRDCAEANGACGEHNCATYNSTNLVINECECQQGFIKKTYNEFCEDIDECKENKDKCRREISKCQNTPGSYQCQCDSPGYQNTDKLTCVDVNECEDGSHKCTQENEQCTNLVGSYRCDCFTGFSRNETACIDTDECLTSPCDSSMQICKNTLGSFSCLLKSNTKTVLISATLVILLLLLFLILILVCIKRVRIKDFMNGKFSKSRLIEDNEVAMETKKEVETAQDTRILLSDLEQFYLTKHQAINDTFSKCPKDCGASKKVASRSELASKNRFKTIFPYDHNRVLLNEKGGDPSSHYINASFISAYETVKDYSFIATQGPKPKTLEDFWRMVVQYSVSVVVMLTKCFEGGSNKCQQYWPERGSEKYGSLLVTLVEVKKTLHVEERVLKVEDKENGIEHTTHHLLFTAWPDKSVPQNAMSLLNLRSIMLHLFNKSGNKTNKGHFKENAKINNNHREDKRQYIVVHCSAGVGRTGTFIGLDHLINEALHRGSIDVFEAMKRLRKQRCLMIQTKSQYEMCYKCMYMYYLIGEDTLVSLEEKKAFEKKMIGLRKIVGGVSLMEKQFQIINDETKSNEVKAVDRTHFELSSGELDAVYASSATKHSRYMVGVAPSSFSKQDVSTLLSQRVGVLLLLDTHNQSMNDLMKSLQDCSNFEAAEATMSFVGQVTNKVGQVMNFKVGDSELYSNAEAVKNSELKKVINVCSVKHDVIKCLYDVVKKEDADTSIMVLSRDTYDDASVLVAGLKVAETIETSRSFDVFQSAFEMRFSQPACLSRIELYEKLYNIAEKLAENSKANDEVANVDDNDDDEDDYENFDQDKYKNGKESSTKKQDIKDVGQNKGVYVEPTEDHLYANMAKM